MMHQSCSSCALASMSNSLYTRMQLWLKSLIDLSKRKGGATGKRSASESGDLEGLSARGQHTHTAFGLEIWLQLGAHFIDINR
jgi:hypothetical protein